MMKSKLLTAALSLIFLFSLSFNLQSSQEKKDEDSNKKKDKWSNTTWKKVGGLVKEKRSFQVEKATTVAGVRGAEAEDTILKQLYYRGKGQFPTRLELKNAVEMLTQIIKTEPDAPSVSESKFYIAQIYEQLGDAEKAVETYQDITKNYPDSEFAVESSTRLGELKK